VSESIHEEDRGPLPMLNANQDLSGDYQADGDRDDQFLRKRADVEDQPPDQGPKEAPLIGEADASGEDNEAPVGVVQKPPIQRPGGFRPDVTDDADSLRAITKNMGKWDRLAEVGQTLQGQGNAARMRGDHRYGAAAAHGLGNFALSVGTGAGAIAGAPAGMAAMTAVGLGSAFAAPVLMSAKAAIGNTLQIAGQTADFIADKRRDALDPKGEARQQVLTDLANRHDFGQDSNSESPELTQDEAAAKTRVAEVDAKGVRFEKDDQAKRVFEGRKRRTGGRLAENAAMSVIKFPWTVGKGLVGLGKKLFTAGSDWWHRKGWWQKRKFKIASRRLAEMERLDAAQKAQLDAAQKAQAAPDNAAPEGIEAGGADAPDNAEQDGIPAGEAPAPDNAAPEGIDARVAAAPAAGKPWKKSKLGVDRGIRLAVRAVRAEQAAEGQGGGIGWKDSRGMGSDDMKKYMALETSVVEGTDKFKRVQNKASEPGYKSIIERGQGAMDPLRPRPIFDTTERFAPNQESAVPGALEGLSTVGKYGKDGLLPVIKLGLPAAIKSANALTTIPELPLLPIALEGLKTAADVGQTAFQAAHQKDDPLANASRERQGLTDMRQMFAAQMAMRQAERGEEGGKSDEAVTAERKVRARRILRAQGRMVLANQKLVKAQAKTGITSLNEYTGQQSNFIANGNVEDEGPLLSSRFAKRFGGGGEAPPDQDLSAVDEQLLPQPVGVGRPRLPSTTEIRRLPDDDSSEDSERFPTETEIRRLPDDDSSGGGERSSTEIERVSGDDNSRPLPVAPAPYNPSGLLHSEAPKPIEGDFGEDEYGRTDAELAIGRVQKKLYG
jgi:hypothetical protein